MLKFQIHDRCYALSTVRDCFIRRVLRVNLIYQLVYENWRK